MTNRKIEARKRVMVALDVDEVADATRLVETLSGEVGWFKIGLQLYTRCGPEIVRSVAGSGAGVFLDLKLHDIPNTVARATAAAAALGVGFLTLHTCGGSAMIRAAAEAWAAAGGAGMLLGVTVLTSLDDGALAEVGVDRGAGEQVARLAGVGLRSGLGGLVAGGPEIARVRAEFGMGPVIVAPGIRPAGEGRQDQARVMTPVEAMRAGADYLVVGRPITGAADPAGAARRVVEEVDRGLAW